VDNQNQSIFIIQKVDIGEWKKDEKRFGIFEDMLSCLTNKQVYHDNDEFKAKSTTREAPSDEDSDVNYDSEVAYIPPMFASLFLKHASYDA